MLAEQPPPEIDWQAVGAAVVGIMAGAGAAIGALWKKLKTGEAKPAPPNGGGAALYGAAMNALQKVAATTEDAADAVRGATDSAIETQAALGSQLGALREVQEKLAELERRERRGIKDLERLVQQLRDEDGGA